MMMSALGAGAYLHHMQIHSADPAALARFYADTLDMSSRRLDSGDWLVEGPQRRLIFRTGNHQGLGFAAYACRDSEGLAGIRARATAAAAELLPSPTPLFGSEAFAVRDPDGNCIVFGLGQREDARTGLHATLQHLTLASANPEAIERFYVDMLGFAVSDTVLDENSRVMSSFMRSNPEHHTLACFRKSVAGIDHHCYATTDWSMIKDWCDRMGERRIPIKWGPGRHGPGNNLFIFVEDPDRNWIEISAELEVVHDRPAKVWPQEEHTLNLWGRGILRQ